MVQGIFQKGGEEHRKKMKDTNFAFEYYLQEIIYKTENLDLDIMNIRNSVKKLRTTWNKEINRK